MKVGPRCREVAGLQVTGIRLHIHKNWGLIVELIRGRTLILAKRRRLPERLPVNNEL